MSCRMCVNILFKLYLYRFVCRKWRCGAYALCICVISLCSFLAILLNTSHFTIGKRTLRLDLSSQNVIYTYNVVHNKTSVTSDAAGDKGNTTIRNVRLLLTYEAMVKMIGTSEPPFTAFSGYLIENPHLCSSVPDLLAVVLVNTATGHYKRRSAIRRTWGNNTFTEHLGSLRVVFLVGKPNSSVIQRRLELENQRYNDIVQGDFMDAYTNLTLKFVMGIKWLKERCMNAKFVVKSDDDVFINTPYLLTKTCKQIVNTQKTIMCNTVIGAAIRRKKPDKWFIHKDQFPNSLYYPTYCHGFFVILSTDLIPYLLEGARRTPLFWVDDVYMTGILPTRIPDFKFSSLHRGVVSLDHQVVVPCFTLNRCVVVAAGEVPVGLFESYWTCLASGYNNGTMDVRLDVHMASIVRRNRNNYSTIHMKHLLMDFLFPSFQHISF